MAPANLNSNTPPQISHLVLLGFILLFMMAYIAKSLQYPPKHVNEVESEHLQIQSDNSPEIGF